MTKKEAQQIADSPNANMDERVLAQLKVLTHYQKKATSEVSMIGWAIMFFTIVLLVWIAFTLLNMAG